MFEFSSFFGDSIGEWNDRMMRRGIFADGGGGAGGATGDDDDESDDDDDDDESGATGKSKSESKGKTYSEAAFRQRLREEKRELRDSLTKDITTKVKADLAREQAAKDGDLQKVIDDLQPKAARVEALEKRVGLFEELATARFEELLDSLPDAIRDLAPDDDADPLEKEKWLLVKAQPAIEKLRKKGLLRDDDSEDDDDAENDGETKREAKNPKRGLNPKDPPARKRDSKRTVKEIIGDYQQSGQYRPMM